MLQRLLAIETSCDETSVALVDVTLEGNAKSCSGSFSALFHHTASQGTLHAPYGGVYPTLAKREHAHNLPLLLHAALRTAESKDASPHSHPPTLSPSFVRWVEEVCQHEPPAFAQALLTLAGAPAPPSLSAIVVTYGPGLDPALWVGVNAARVLAKGWEVPLWGAHHLEGHLVSACTTKQDAHLYALEPLSFPLVGLIVSGGHTDLIAASDWSERRLLGRTRDDAAGEAFDKAARMLGLPYPGGPAIAALAQEARSRGEQLDEHLPRPMKDDPSLDFSFAGLKTALRRSLQKRGYDPEHPTLEPSLQRAYAREVEEAIVETLLAKVQKARHHTQARTVALGGGVAANAYLTARLREWAKEEGVALRVPDVPLATDNALMVAMGAALDMHLSLIAPASPDVLRPDPNAPWPGTSAAQ